MLDALTMTDAGMSNDVQRMHAISHNLANASTVGFKREITVARAFTDHLSGATGSISVDVRPALTDYVDHSAGSLKYTANPLDLGLEGDGYFVVTTPAGEAYTRQGNLRVDADGRLVTAGGHPVLGTGGEIRLTAPEPRIDNQGYVWEGATQVGQLKLMSVRNPESMTTLGQGLYMMTDATELGDGTLGVRQGFIETANVVAMNEMIKMIETVRHFETSQKLIRAYDAMLDRAINTGGEV
jgi:flagellar basal-body rod protein FlgF